MVGSSSRCSVCLHSLCFLYVFSLELIRRNGFDFLIFIVVFSSSFNFIFDVMFAPMIALDGILFSRCNSSISSTYSAKIPGFTVHARNRTDTSTNWFSIESAILR